MTIRLTVLIPNYNGSKFLAELFASLSNQHQIRFRCIFLDDGSTDNSVEIAKTYQKTMAELEIIEHKNVGISASWNRGIELVESEFFSILHCDDSYEPEYLVSMLKLMDQFPNAAIGHCAVTTINEHSQLVASAADDYKHNLYMPRGNFNRSNQEEYSLLLSGNFINCPSVVFRTKLAKKVGLFNNNLKQVLDWEYWFRVLLSDFSICGTSVKLYRYRRHSGNATVKNSKDTTRYSEELALLRWAQQAGLEKNMTCLPLDTSIVRNIIIFDFAEALSKKEISAATQKINFLDREKLTHASTISILRLLIFWGPWSGMLLKGCIYLFLECKIGLHRLKS